MITNLIFPSGVVKFGDAKVYLRETENPNRSGYSPNNLFKIVDLPAPLGPDITIGRLPLPAHDGPHQRWVCHEPGTVRKPIGAIAESAAGEGNR